MPAHWCHGTPAVGYDALLAAAVTGETAVSEFGGATPFRFGSRRIACELGGFRRCLFLRDALFFLCLAAFAFRSHRIAQGSILLLASGLVRAGQVCDPAAQHQTHRLILSVVVGRFQACKVFAVVAWSWR
ncbi:hypothetical protein [Rhodococcus erythropolis]|uniref:hypothetical protein n=1 Tax=Rhodococcus erythropolis TaxID=1833 RepID=UPI00294AC2C1|nr:hypothetical protein [Rhodococcus erythropolis]